MNTTLETIPFLNLALSFSPVIIVLVILYRWSLSCGTAIYAVLRMVAQLLLVGYVLTFLFESTSASMVLATLSVMLAAASWIALRPLSTKSKTAYLKMLGSISVGGVLTLILVTQGVLNLEPWFEPHLIIPLAGMLFATSMNTVSLAAERYEAESQRGADYHDARHIALRAALIPMINSLFAVGFVSFPGMMTGQILSGISPLVAVRYQIMVMCMLFGSSGICAICYLLLQRLAVAQTCR